MTDDPRCVLRDAIAQREQRRAEVQAAEAAADRARQLLDDAEATLATFKSVDAELTAHRSAGIKAFARGGSKPSLQLPPDLVARRGQRDAARENVDAARAAHAELAHELAAARAELAHAEAAVREAAGGVMAEEATELAVSLRCAQTAAWRLGVRLRALGKIAHGNGFVVHLSQQVHDALDMREPTYAPDAPGSGDMALAHARGYLERLMASADARDDV